MSADQTPINETFDSLGFQAAIKQALQQTMFLNALGINPRQLRDAVGSCTSCFKQFLIDGEVAPIEQYGQQLANIGMGHQGMLALTQSITQWCGTSEDARLREIALSWNFILPLLKGYMQDREQRILFQQEQTRIALDRARESY